MLVPLIVLLMFGTATLSTLRIPTPDGVAKFRYNPVTVNPGDMKRWPSYQRTSHLTTSFSFQSHWACASMAQLITNNVEVATRMIPISFTTQR